MDRQRRDILFFINTFEFDCRCGKNIRKIGLSSVHAIFPVSNGGIQPVSTRGAA